MGLNAAAAVAAAAVAAAAAAWTPQSELASVGVLAEIDKGVVRCGADGL